MRYTPHIYWKKYFSDWWASSKTGKRLYIRIKTIRILLYSMLFIRKGSCKRFITTLN